MFDVDPELERATTPPGSVYGDPGAHTRITGSVFPQSWQADLASPPGRGAARGWIWLAGSIAEPMLWTRGADGELRCLSNVCTHRGAIVCAESGRAAALRCRYHGRRFHADGSLATAPGFDDAEDFPSPRDDLVTFDHAEWGPLAFARCDASDAALSTALAPLDDRVAPLTPASWSEDPESRRTHHVDANWLLYLENYLEGWHVPFVHPELARHVDLADYEIECFDHGVLQTAFARDGDPALQHDGRRVAAWYFHLFPNTLLNVYPWGLSLNVVRPLGPMRTAIDYAAFVRDPELREDGAGSGLDRTELQDQQIVMSAQAGVRSRAYRGGRYSPEHERGLHHFHRWIGSRVQRSAERS